MKFPVEFSNKIKFDNTILNDWTLENAGSGDFISSECGFYDIVGGFGNFGGTTSLVKSLASMPPHYKIGIFFDFYKFDAWDTERFLIYVDSMVVFTSEPFLLNGPAKSNAGQLCGQIFTDDKETVYQIFDHSSTSLTFKLTTNIITYDPYQKSWGINNFQLSLFSCDPTCFTCKNSNEKDCLSCYNHASLNTMSQCICDEGYYMLPYATPCYVIRCSECRACMEGCQICLDGLSCSKANIGYYLSLFDVICISPPCYKSLQCIAGCDTCLDGISCLVCSVGYYLIKIYSTCTLKCPDNMVIFNNICLVQCPDELFLYGNACVSECPLYLYFDNKTCISQCPYDEFLDVKICYFVCPDLLVGFNRTCLDHCPENFEKVNKICICPTGFFLILDTQCVSQCPVRSYANLNTCDSCHIQCKTCTGANDNQCLSCYNPLNFLLKSASTCYENCPDFYYSDPLKMECFKCPNNCQNCINQSICHICNINYQLIHNICKYVKEVKGELISISNPFTFKLNLSENWLYFFNNYKIFFKSISLDNLENDKDYSFILDYNKSDPQNISLLLKYEKKFQESLMKIWVFGEDQFSDNLISLKIDQNFSILLQSQTFLCTASNQYYSQSI